MRTTSSVYCRVVSVRSSRGLGVLSFRRATGLLLKFFSRRARRGVHRQVLSRNLASRGRRMICVHTYMVKGLRGRYIGIFLGRRRRVLTNAFRKYLVRRVTRRRHRTCRGYARISHGGVCTDGPILSVRLSNCGVVTALVRIFVSTTIGPSHFCSGRLLEEMDDRCSVRGRGLRRQVVTVLSCVDNVASVCTLSVCRGVGKVDLPVI